MPNDSVIKLIQPGTFDDQLTEVLRNGARTLLTQAVEAEVSEFLAKHADLKTPDGHRRVYSPSHHHTLSSFPSHHHLCLSSCNLMCQSRSLSTCDLPQYA